MYTRSLGIKFNLLDMPELNSIVQHVSCAYDFSFIVLIFKTQINKFVALFINVYFFFNTVERKIITDKFSKIEKDQTRY